MVARRVASLSLGVFASPGYLASAGTPAHPAERENSHHRIVGFSWGRAGNPYPLAMHRDAETVNMQSRYAVDGGEACLAAGAPGLDIMCLPRYIANAHPERGERVARFGDWRLDPMPLYIAYPQNRHVSAKLRVCMDWWPC
jgi:DNA-binding transcriptional LysR family regulator